MVTKKKEPWYEADNEDEFILEPKCRIKCCDCGLVHKFDIKLWVKMKRDQRSTGQVRRHMLVDKKLLKD